MADNKIFVEIDLDEKGAVKELNQFEKRSKKAGEKSGEGFSKGFSTVLKGSISSFVGNLGASLVRDALAGFKNEIKGIVSAAASLEVIETQFKTILKSTSAAQKQISDLQKFAATTPFQLEGLSLATRQLLSFGTAQEDIIPTLRQLGDLAAGTGAQIDELTIPFGRLVSTQKLTLVELDKFADRGINLFGELSKQTGISLKNIRDEISKGTIPFKEFTTAISNLTSEGGLFFGATEAQSKTLSGVISTLGDNFFNLEANIGKAFSPFLISAIESITVGLQELNEQVLNNFNVFDDLLIPLTQIGNTIITSVIAPLELLKNIFSLIQDSANLFAAGIVSSFGSIAGAAGDFIEFMGQGGETSQALQTFRDSSKEVFNDVAKDATASFNSITDFPFSDNLAMKNEELRAGLVAQRAIIQEESALTGEVVKQNATALAESNSQVASSLFDVFENVNISINNTTTKMAESAKKIGAIVKGGLAKSIAGGIQNITNSLLQGQNIFENFGKFILNTFGDLAIQLGTFFITQGIAVEALKSLGGTAAIAAGAALVALGTIMKSLGGGGGSAAAGGGSGAVGGGDSTTQDTDVTADPERNGVSERQTNLTINVEGSLVQQEELGRFTAQALSEAGAKEGIVIADVVTV